MPCLFVDLGTRAATGTTETEETTIIRSIVELLGIGLAGIGLALIYWPAALIAVGIGIALWAQGGSND